MQSLDPDAEPDDHARYAEMIGAPEMLVRLDDCIFEALPGALAMEWPVRFTIALRDSSADEEALRRACMRFLHTTVSRSLERYADAETRAACQPALNIVAASAKGQPISAEKAAADSVRAASVAVAWASEASALAARAAAWAARAAADSVRAATAAAVQAEWAVSDSVRAAMAVEALAVAAAMAVAEKARDAAKEAAYTEMAATLIAEIEAAS
jgi:hypothetical protein